MEKQITITIQEQESEDSNKNMDINAQNVSVFDMIYGAITIMKTITESMEVEKMVVLKLIISFYCDEQGITKEELRNEYDDIVESIQKETSTC